MACAELSEWKWSLHVSLASRAEDVNQFSDARNNGAKCNKTSTKAGENNIPMLGLFPDVSQTKFDALAGVDIGRSILNTEVASGTGYCATGAKPYGKLCRSLRSRWNFK